MNCLNGAPRSLPASEGEDQTRPAGISVPGRCDGAPPSCLPAASCSGGGGVKPRAKCKVHD